MKPVIFHRPEYHERVREAEAELDQAREWLKGSDAILRRRS
jgi:hypothetical protein